MDPTSSESKKTCAACCKATSAATTFSRSSTPATRASTSCGRWASCGRASVDDVVAAVRYAAENHLPIHARGAGTGLAGESLGRGLVIDFSRYFRRIVADEGDRVRVQPGVVLRIAQSLPRPQRPAVRPRSRRCAASPRWAASWRSTPAAATGRATARPAGTSKSCKSCWPMARVHRVGRHADRSTEQRHGDERRRSPRRRPAASISFNRSPA